MVVGCNFVHHEPNILSIFSLFDWRNVRKKYAYKNALGLELLVPTGGHADVISPSIYIEEL